MWREAHGPIPDGHVVTFLNGDTQDLRLENLALVSQATHVRMNQSQLRHEDPELTKTGIVIGQLMTETGKARRRLKNA